MPTTVQHGQIHTTTYYSWCAMKSRCSNPNNNRYHAYGARGITVCKRWKKFVNFLADMGHRPKGTEIGRLNSNGNFEPGNCRWTTSKVNQNNRRTNRRLTFRGETLTVSQWADRIGVRQLTLIARLHRGWPIERTLTEPVRPARPRKIPPKLTFRKRTMTVAQWAKRLGMSSGTLRRRLHLGWPIDRALTLRKRAW